jgi:predicted flap endonuclease-1-like 5' DNA nuclease
MMANKILVRMVKLAQGPAGTWRPGQELRLPAARAMALIESGAATPVGELPATSRETATAGPPERRAPLTTIEGVDAEMAAALADRGIEDPVALAAADAGTLISIKGVGAVTARRLVEAAQEALE